MSTAHERAALTAVVQEILDGTPGLLEDLRQEAGLIAEVADTTAAVDLMAWRPALRALASHVRQHPRAPTIRTLHWRGLQSKTFLALRGGGERAIEVSLTDLR